MKSTALFRLLTILLLLALNNSSAQAADVEMADLMRSNGMIYVVISVLCIIFVGILTFLFIIERRLKKLEKGEE